VDYGQRKCVRPQLIGEIVCPFPHMLRPLLGRPFVRTAYLSGRGPFSEPLYDNLRSDATDLRDCNPLRCQM